MPNCLSRTFSCRRFDDSPPYRGGPKPSYKPSPLARISVSKDEKVQDIRLEGIQNRVIRGLENVRHTYRPGSSRTNVKDSSPTISNTADDDSWVTIENSPKPKKVPVHIRRQQLRALHALGGDQQEAVGKHMQKIDTSIVSAKRSWKQAVESAKGTLDSAISLTSDGGSSPIAMPSSTHHTRKAVLSPLSKPDDSIVVLKITNGSMDRLPVTRNNSRPNYMIVGSTADLPKAQSYQRPPQHRRGMLSTDSAMLVPEEGDDVHTFDHIIDFEHKLDTLTDIASAVREQERKDREKKFAGKEKKPEAESPDGKFSREEDLQTNLHPSDTVKLSETKAAIRNSRRIEWWLQSVYEGESF